MLCALLLVCMALYNDARAEKTTYFPKSLSSLMPSVQRSPNPIINSKTSLEQRAKGSTIQNKSKSSTQSSIVPTVAETYSAAAMSLLSVFYGDSSSSQSGSIVGAATRPVVPEANSNRSSISWLYNPWVGMSDAGSLFEGFTVFGRMELYGQRKNDPLKKSIAQSSITTSHLPQNLGDKIKYFASKVKSFLSR